MSHMPIDPEEMAKRLDEDVNAALKMIGEGSPIFESYPYGNYEVFESEEPHNEKELPESYQ
ncbi:hypothetical protein [Sporosarcina ureilytica]|uniref:Uncharacterized protein n=1 Tax=Sporosarcina ureilytica TaxID=298596 RepID=A0A1D8JCQ4_9BACL|nr:hypothetical protein [Sporosarcina ureilytica]AOV06483.1 hypothetical protein BI350_01915 [Sporosarcina ureilytica]